MKLWRLKTPEGALPPVPRLSARAEKAWREAPAASGVGQEDRAGGVAGRDPHVGGDRDRLAAVEIAEGSAPHVERELAVGGRHGGVGLLDPGDSEDLPDQVERVSPGKGQEVSETDRNWRVSSSPILSETMSAKAAGFAAGASCRMPDWASAAGMSAW